ncbi:BQ5605_C002g01263 [Microbotryum silenes-dioicae]|uniref:BQ5605_C002g01263 protein n=1 Tax=Microbotryum silenes-dioicae TaxID=796604 RepID=A0A2X0LYC7_9BASI|nr:BQ5605_C002g01263 [Microbotryum silenes-dioicae]
MGGGRTPESPARGGPQIWTFWDPENRLGSPQIWTFLAQNGSRLTSFLDIFLPPVEL